MDDLQFSELHPLPRARWYNGWLWAAPVKPGLYGQTRSEILILSPNHNSLLARLREAVEAYSASALAIDTGGFALQTAIVLESVDEQKVQGAINTLPASLNPSVTRILIPHGLAKTLGWQEQTPIGDYSIQVIPDDLSTLGEYITDPELNAANEAGAMMPGILRRLLVGLSLCLGQALIFAVPLVIFGWQSLLWGNISLLAGTLFLALFWRMLPGAGWLRGLIAGSVLALIAEFGFLFVIEANLVTNIRLFVGLWLTATWMGVVLTGASSK